MSKEAYVWDITGTQKIKVSTIKRFMVVGPSFGDGKFRVVGCVSPDVVFDLREFDSLVDAQIFVNQF